MNLVFNKADKGNEELYEHLGFIDAYVSYENMKRFIRNATRDVILIIGEATYNVIKGYYAGETTPEQLPYVDALQDAIAVQAYRHYAPSKDVSHTQNGRKMRIDDHEKIAFEWIIDKDNENLERLYYQALDHLLIELENLDSFKETNEYRALNSLFVNTTQDFQNYFNINHSRLLMLKLQPGMKQCERMQILPRLGKEAFDALKEDPSSNEQLLDLIKNACVYWSLYWAFSGRLTVTLFPQGVLQRYTSDRNTNSGKKPAMLNETAWAAQEFKKDADALLIAIEQEVAPEVEVTQDTEEEEEEEHFGFLPEDGFIST